ncbi:KAP family P-loop NTPase fold protein [Sphingobium sp. Ant17]|uniref:KAP family P-loop NTPase fold protein n=1 Tax=Sphingobium sp. Ant17 TaxID=1461752 RepID=UPI00044EDC2F|nr:P-loop NTPase fold protein [Sphingobium sp. Ant17]EXS71381.1 hypothetical protein BF95_03690 [Sphingobium sp. Ant17]
MRNLDQIWEGDKLDRRSEARLLERFLLNETDTLKRLGRSQSFVLALDAQYGEGKSWFLDRFAKQLAINHPVAFVDAWIDDANNEPLVSIMSALDEALQPFLKSEKVKNRLGDLTRAALPILGKAAISAGGRLAARYIGDQIGKEAKAAIDAARTKRNEEVIEAGFDKLTEEVSEVVDSAGKALLEQYRVRQNSRRSFKDSLEKLAASIEKSDVDPRQAPIFVVVDELDRCRPDYAIALLESIKHLFDVPGVVFVIALHGRQLTASIEAVYGAKFDATAYLRRFFTRHYELRRLSISELVIGLFGDIPPSEVKFSFPDVEVDGKHVILTPEQATGLLLSEWRATPREAQAVVDALRLFISNWDHGRVPIELPLLLALLLNLVRGNELEPHVDTLGPPELRFLMYDSDGEGNVTKHTSTELFPIYQRGFKNSLDQISRNNEDHGLYGYMTRTLGDEYQVRFNRSHRIGSTEQLPTWSEYRNRVRELMRFVEVVDQDGNRESVSL